MLRQRGTLIYEFYGDTIQPLATSREGPCLQAVLLAYSCLCLGLWQGPLCQRGRCPPGSAAGSGAQLWHVHCSHGLGWMGWSHCQGHICSSSASCIFVITTVSHWPAGETPARLCSVSVHCLQNRLQASKCMLVCLQCPCNCLIGAFGKWLHPSCRCPVIHLLLSLRGLKNWSPPLPATTAGRHTHKQYTCLGVPQSLRTKLSASFLCLWLTLRAEACWSNFLAGFYAAAYCIENCDLNDSINSPEKSASLFSLIFSIWKSAEDTYSHIPLSCRMFQSAASIMKSN